MDKDRQLLRREFIASGVSKVMGKRLLFRGLLALS